MNRLTYFLKIVCLTVLCCLSINCDQTNNDDELTYPSLNLCVNRIEGYFYIAEILPMAFIGKSLEPPIILAISEINAGGGIHNKRLGLIACDTEGDIARTETIMKELGTVEQLSSIIGPGFSSVALEIIDEAVQNNHVLISPSATAAELTTVDDNGLFFRTTASDTTYAKVAASIANTGQYQKALVMHEDNTWGAGLAANFELSFEGAVEKLPYDGSLDNFAADVIAAAKVFNPDVVYLVAYPPHTEALLKAAIAAGDFFPQWISYGQHSEILTGIGPYINGATGVTKLARNSDPSYQLYINNFNQAFGSTDTNSPEPYDATYALAIAMSLSDAPNDGIQVRDNLKNINTGNVVRPSQWTEILSNIPSGTMNYEGASGTMEFDENGDIYYDFQQWEIQNEQFISTKCWSWEGNEIPCE